MTPEQMNMCHTHEGHQQGDPRDDGTIAGSRRLCFLGPLFPRRICYGVAMSGGVPAIVRSRRLTAKRISHVVVTPTDPAAWRQWLAEAGQANVIVAGCLAVQESLTLWLQTPFPSIQKAEKVLPSLLDIQLPFPLESCHYRFVQMRRMPDGATHALAVAARQESIKARLESYQAQRIDPVALDHEGLALWTQSLEECPLPSDRIRIILYLDSDHTTLVVGQAEHYRNAHSLQGSLPALSAGGDARLAVEGLATRLQRILRAEIPSDTSLHWVACGAGARNTALLNALHQKLAEEWPGPMTVHQEPETLLVRALSARALTPGPLRCNLRMHDLTHPLVSRWARRQSMTTAALFLIAGLLLCGMNLTWRLLSGHRVAGVKRAISSLAAELAPGIHVPYGQEVRVAQQVIQQQWEQMAPFLNAFTPSLLIRLAELIRIGTEAEVAYETLSLQRNGVSITGTAEDWDQCEQLTLRLKALGYAVSLERQEALAENQVHFSVNGNYIGAK